ncbi:MAG: S8 family serine peptidase [Nanoarchaeota archaeon]|nr:S8 family serine peptidase [Nanoarchaeota archaeon]
MKKVVIYLIIGVIVVSAFGYFYLFGEVVRESPDETNLKKSGVENGAVENAPFGNHNSVGWIVMLKEPGVLEKKVEIDKSDESTTMLLTQHREKIQNQQLSFERELRQIVPNGRIRAKFKNVLNAISVSGDFTQEQLNQLQSLEEVETITPNWRFDFLLRDSVPLINADDVWELDRNGRPCEPGLPAHITGNPISEISPEPTTEPTPRECLTGKGVTIGIIDSGVDYTHADLGSCTTQQFLNGECEKVISGYDFGDDDYDPMDEIGHGTHVASIAAGDGVLKGVAHGASIVAYKVIGSGDLNLTAVGDNILQAIEASVDPNGDGNFSDRVDILSMSVGFGCWPYTSECGPDDIFSQAVDNAVSLGVTVVVASGNDGAFGGGEESIGTPATARKAITVGSVDKNLEYVPSSSKGPVRWENTEKDFVLNKPDVVAPGVEICAARAFLYQGGGSCIDESHALGSGTSMATPHVSGLVALMLQKNPFLTPEEIKSAIKSTSHLLVNQKPLVNYQGAGIIDSIQAVFSDKPIFVYLEPIEKEFGSEQIIIRGKINNENLEYYDLSQSLLHPTVAITELDEWHVIDSQYNPNTGIIEGGFNFSNSKKRVIRLRAVNTLGQEFVDYGYLYLEGCGNGICDRGENFTLCPDDCIIHICTAEELDLLPLHYIDRKYLQNQTPSYKIYQECDIDFGSYEYKDYFEPIPLYYGTTYQGRGHMIKNLNYETNDSIASLFTLKRDHPPPPYPTPESTYFAGFGIENVTLKSQTTCGGLFSDLLGDENLTIKALYVKDGLVECSFAGGLVGMIREGDEQTGDILINYVYSNIFVNGATSGGIIGFVEEPARIIMNLSYWDTQTSGQSESAGGGDGRTTEEMTTVPRPNNTYVDWDFFAVWEQEDGDYPKLRVNG